MSERGLVTIAIVEDLDVVEDDHAHLRSGLVFDRSVQDLDLGFGRRSERLHRSIFVGVTGKSKTRGNVPRRKTVRGLQTRILRALIAVMDQLLVG